MEYELRADGTLTPLPEQNVDTGMGVERLAAIVQDVRSVYETDGYQAIMHWIEAESGVAWDVDERGDEGAPHPRRPRARDDLPRRRRRHALERGRGATCSAGSSAGPCSRRARSASSSSGALTDVVVDADGAVVSGAARGP